MFAVYETKAFETAKCAPTKVHPKALSNYYLSFHLIKALSNWWLIKPLLCHSKNILNIIAVVLRCLIENPRRFQCFSANPGDENPATLSSSDQGLCFFSPLQHLLDFFHLIGLGLCACCKSGNSVTLSHVKDLRYTAVKPYKTRNIMQPGTLFIIVIVSCFFVFFKSLTNRYAKQNWWNIFS